jgi:hypothetical protein
MPDTPVAPQGGGPYDPALEARVSRLEEDMRESRTAWSRAEASLARIEATLPHLATKAHVAELRAEMEQRITGVEVTIGRVETQLAEKPGRTYLWGILGVLLAAYACGLAALAVLK